MSGVVLLVLRLLLAITLYVFLGYSLLIMWRDMKFQKEVVSSWQVPSIGIRFNEEKDQQTFKFQGPEITLGRNPASICVLDSEKVSANHAIFTYNQGQWWFEDLESTNGSFLNGERVIQSTVVVDGDDLLCGDVPMKIILEVI